MGSMKYRGWTIATSKASEGFVALLTDPDGKRFDEPLVFLASPELAELYARNFINWYIDLEEERRMTEGSMRTSMI
ncbi:hypothetical protein [Gloeobacter violaceus]|uniref:Gsr3564 protein n=1 Tax=Gloeobacter violaceus (strain ATCC 29082 / PCC 7421) TaxID=251221 RepID=Q7NFG1_GLOVI|nr:hypothetical protein [Gloeobacter violaceus]BAC91505.1 gsr3564 [Gloeobacter violaceus PCC 7421]